MRNNSDKSHINDWGNAHGEKKGSTKSDRAKLSPLLRQLLKESDINIDNLPPQYLAWLEQQAMDGNLVDPETKGENLTLRTQKSSLKKPKAHNHKEEDKRCENHEESHKWRSIHSKRNGAISHVERLAQEDGEKCHGHHLHPVS